MLTREYKVILVAMSGVRVHNQRLMDLGLTLPGFVDRSKVIASLPSLGLLTLAAHTPPNWQTLYFEIDEFHEDDFNFIVKEKPNVFAFSSLTASINKTYALSERLMNLGIKVVIGG